MTSEETVKPMESIFHEKQEGSLCAQHCLNALLQGQYFTAVDLAEIARKLDTLEQQQMAQGGEHSAEYQHFMQQPSSNYDDSGFFSIQVIQEALKVWNLELIPYTSSNPIALEARRDPRSQKCYICNFREHWFTIRYLGTQWFNLNSLLVYPELVSDTYLTLFLTQLQQEGYSIFIAVGIFPPCDAEDILNICPAVQKIKPLLINEPKHKFPGGSSSVYDDAELQRALEESRRLVEDNDESLNRALALSIESMPADYHFSVIEPTPSKQPNASTSKAAEPSKPLSLAEIRMKRLASFEKPSPTLLPPDVATAEAMGIDIRHEDAALHKVPRSQSEDSKSESKVPRSQSEDARSESKDRRSESEDPMSESEDPRSQSEDPRSESEDTWSQSILTEEEQLNLALQMSMEDS